MESTDCEYDSEGEGPRLGSDYHCQESRRILYLASQHLHGVIIDTPALSGWSHIANDIRDSAQQLIPPQLFNFLAWITGSADVVELDNFVETGDGIRRKLLSVAHDIIYIYISTKRRKTMPKHVALGLTMRHMTGSSTLIGILNGLGHSVSHSAVPEHDTVLVNKQVCTDNTVPEGFSKTIPTTVIWDNNDFREETPSGEGSTHNTNLVQIIGCVDDGTESIPCINSEFKYLTKKRSVDPPPNVLEVYHKRKRQGPNATSYQSVIHEHSTNEYLQSKQSLDIAYCLSKLPRVRWTYSSWMDRVHHASKFHYYSSPVKTSIPSSDRCQINKNGHCLHHFNAKCCYC